MKFIRPPESIVLHPFFFGLFPLFSLLSVNLGWAAFHEALLPAAAILTLAGVLWLVLWPILPEPRKRGLVLSLFWLPFFCYGATLDFVRAQLNFRDMFSLTQIALIGCTALLVASALLYALRRSPWTFVQLNRFLNRLSAIMLAIAVVSCVLVVAQRKTAPPQAPEPQPIATAPNTEGATVALKPTIQVAIGPEQRAALPNIYFIICDAYPRSDALKEFFDYDDTPFLNQLRERGFYVADRSRSNYCLTLSSLGSTLNMKYLDDPESSEPAYVKKNHGLLISLLQDNLVVRTLKAQGYEFVAIASGQFPTMMEGADRLIRPGAAYKSEYQQHFDGRTPARFVRPGAFNITEYQQSLIDMTPVRSIMNRMGQLWWYQLVPFSLDTLVSLRSEGQPMFVFAHLLAPHRPHGYDSDGKLVEEFLPYKEGWRAVTQFLNTRLIEVVDEIQANEPNSIIIIQGDHGSNAAIHATESNWQGDTRDYIRSRSANLSTFYFPDRQYDGLLYPEITPINTFRIIFNKYLGTNLELLEDVTFMTPPDSAEPVKITEVY